MTDARRRTRFQIDEVELGYNEGSPHSSNSSGSQTTETSDTPTMMSDGSDRSQRTVTSKGNLALYKEDLENRPRINSVLATIHPVNGIVPNAANKDKEKASLGTILGVYLPTVQNIVGVIMFLRLPWIVGIAGVGMAFLIMALCCSCTLLTALSLSAIATNGRVPGGGVYYLLSRNLGREFGGAVGVLFYFANTFSTSMYIVGSIEILVTYIVPQAALFGDVNDPSVRSNNVRLYGTILLFLLTLIVFVGVKIVSWFGTFCLAAVLLAIVCVYAEAFVPTQRVLICELDGVGLQTNSSLGQFDFSEESIMYLDDLAENFSMKGVPTDCLLTNLSVDPRKVCSEHNPSLKMSFAGSRYYNFRPDFVPSNNSLSCDTVDPRVGNWTTVTPNITFGIPGITRSYTIVENTPTFYVGEGEAKPGVSAVPPQLQAVITADFLLLIGICFPSVTGIMAGSNRSGDLKDAQKSIPIGTIAAILTTSFLYLSMILFFGGTIRRLMLVDQFGAVSGGLTISLLAFNTKWVILIGALLASIGACLQSLTGAPRLLQAIAKDDLITFLSFFKRPGLNGEPSFALVLTALLAEVGILIASLDEVAPILTMFFLICYMFVNFACTLQSILKAPSWRPRFRFYHWTTSLLGALLCFVLMFLVRWYYAIVALLLAFFVYKYIEYKGAKKDWGDGVTGLNLQAALYSLHRLEEGLVHTKNWRPQILLLCKLDQSLMPTDPKLFSFASQLKAGKGLVIVSTVIRGKPKVVVPKFKEAKENMRSIAKSNKIAGFYEVVASDTIEAGLSQCILSSGLGALKHNTVVLGWPETWRNQDSMGYFIEALRVASIQELAVLVPKNINLFPTNQDHMKGFIDIWWVVNDGGLLMLLPFLLLQHKVWKQCKLRIFTIAQIEDNSIQMKKDLVAFLYQLRIPASVDVIEMSDNDITAYTYERTLKMEQRNKILKKLRMSDKEKKGDVQHLVGRSFSISPRLFHEKEEIYTSSEGDIITEEPAITTSQPPMESESIPLLHSGNPSPASFNSITENETVIPVEDVESPLKEPEPANVQQMNTAIKLNKLMISRSIDSALVIVNLPALPPIEEREENYMEFLEVLTEGLKRVLMVRGGGREVVTIFS